MKPDNKAGGPWLYALGLIPVVWFALLIAPSLSGGLSEIVNALPAAMNHPFQIVWCEDSIKAVLIFIAAYGLGIGIYLSSRRNYRRGEEHGSAKWGDPRAVNKKYRDKDPFQNRIFTQHVRMGLDGKSTAGRSIPWYAAAAEQEKAGSMQSPTCSRRPMSLTLCWTVKANCCATAGACWNGWATRSRW